MVTVFTSCQKHNEHTQHNSRLRINFQDGDVPSLHPSLLTAHIRGLSLGRWLYEGLMRIDHNGQPGFAGAEKVEISQDKKTYVFTLRDHKWSDGSTVSADHYVATWRHALTPQADCPRADLFYLIKNGQKAKKGEVAVEEVGVHALNPTTLMIELEHPSPHFLQLLAHPLFVPLKDPFSEPTVFNGPFIPKKWEKGTCMTLASNEYFWNHDHVSLSHIDIDFIDDPTTPFYMFEKQQIDWIGASLSLLTKEVGTKLLEQNTGYLKPVNRFFWIYLNTSHPVLRSAKMRKALALSIDCNQIAKHIFIADEPLLAPVHADMIPLPVSSLENPMTARELFEEGLKELNLTKDTCPPLILSYANCAGFKSLSEYIKTTWEEMSGLHFELQGMEWNVFRNNLEKGAYQIGGCYQSIMYDDPLEIFERFEELGNANFSQWENAGFKEKLALIRQEIDEQKQKELLVEAERILIEQMPFIPVCRGVHVYAHHPGLKHYILESDGSIDFAYSTMER